LIDDAAQSGANTNLNRALDQLWSRFRPEIEERVRVLAAAAASAAQAQLGAPECEAAHAAAHKLAGVLGTFGLARGTELARDLELAFSGVELDRESALRLPGAVADLRAVIDRRKVAR
jgi:HPt (histidine-containing phosphotransfer) domain-containing protein